MEKFVLSLLLLLSFYSEANAYFITVDAHAEECFFDRVKAGTNMGFTFEIAEGGFLDIDVRIVGPDGSTKYQGEQKGNGKYTFAADISGDYTYCFNNQKSTITSKVVMFNMEIVEPLKPPGEHDTAVEGQEVADHASLGNMIDDLRRSLFSVKNEQEYMQVRGRNHHAINESTNFRVVLWSIFEASVLFTMTLGQVFYLKRFFEVRRVV